MIVGILFQLLDVAVVVQKIVVLVNKMKLKQFIILIIILSQQIFAIKTEVFKYKIYPTEHFDIYYPKEELKFVLPEVEKILEDTFKENVNYFNVKFDYKIPFFLYYGYQQFLQNTIVNVSEGTGGVTEAFKNRFLVPYTGSKKWLQHVINHEFIHEIEYNILYSGVWKTPLLLKSIFYPHWLLEGLAEYRAALYTKTLQEMMVRDMAISKKLIPLQHLHNFSHLKPHMILPAYEESAKLMEFIEKEYGKDKLVSILKIYKEKFEPNSVLNIVLGLTLDKLQNKFFEEMETAYNYEVQVNSMTDLNDKFKVSKNDVYPVHYYLPVSYMDNIIYLGDPEGKLLFYFINQKESKQKLLIPKRIVYKYVDIIQTDNTNISISKNGILCFSGIKNNKSYLYLYEIKTKKIKKIDVSKAVDLLVSTYISHDGDCVYFSGIKNTKSFIYKYTLSTKKFLKIKEDENFISYLTISPKQEKLLYVKEVPCKKQNKDTWENDVFLFDLNLQQEKRITFTMSNEVSPVFITEESILFVSDYNKDYEKKLYGVNNVFLIDLKFPTEMVQLTNVIGGVTYVNFCNNNILLSYYRDFNQHIYSFSLEEFIKINNTIEVYKQENKEETFTDLRNQNIGSSKNYVFKFSTDLFLPFIYYSSYEGLMMLLYWQGSDMVGEHNVGITSIVLGDKNYSLNLQYQFSKLRPTIIFNTIAESYDNVSRKTLNRYIEGNVGIQYPLSNISSIGMLLRYSKLDKYYQEQNTTEVERENIIYLAYVRSTIIGKFLEPTSGSYSSLSLQISDKFIDGTFSYNIYNYFFVKYFNLGKEHSLFLQLKVLSSTGKDKKNFYLGGPERISGIWYDDIKSSQIYIGKIGWRFPVVYDINYYMWYMFPDLFFKGFYGETFCDFGFDEKFSSYSSLGIKFKLYSFILQTYVLKFELTFAKQFDINKPIYVYFNAVGGF